MPLADANSLSTLAGFRNHCARRLGASSYATLGTDDAAALDDCQALAMDRLTKEAHWQFLEDDAEFVTGITAAGPTQSLTADLTAGSTSVTNFSSNLTTLGIVHDDLLNNGEGGFYRIDSASGTTATLKAGYAGATATTEGVTLARDRYNLAAGLLWIESLLEIETDRRIPILSLDEWEAKTGGKYETGTPRFAMLVGADSTQSETSTNQRIQLWPIPDGNYAYSYRYKKLPTYTDANVFAGPHNMDLLIHATMTELFGMRGDVSAAQWHDQRYRALLPNAIRQDVNRARTSYRAARQFGRTDGRARRPRYQDPLVE